MPMAASPPFPDWLKVQDTLAQQPVMGVNVHARPQMMGEPQQYGMMAPEAYWAGGGGQAANAEAVPFGSLLDPVSQAAFLAAPGVQALARQVLPQAGMSAPRLPTSFLAQQRGNLGRPSMSASGEVLPESMVRDEAGNLQRLYHGTKQPFADFEASKFDPGGLYGPGVYMTESPEVAGGGMDLLHGQPIGYANAGRMLHLERMLKDYEGQLAELPPASPWRESVVRGMEQAQAEMATLHPNMRPVYADLKRPFDADTGSLDPEAIATASQQALARWGQTGNAELETLIAKTANRTTPITYEEVAGWVGKPYTNQLLKKLGYDGITHIGGGNTGGQSHRVFIAFSPDSVYPSFNVDALRPPQ